MPAPDEGSTKPDEAAKPAEALKARDQLIAWARTALPAVLSTLGLTGFVSVLGAAVVWSRFNAVGLPAEQAVADQPTGSLIVTGAASLAIYLFLGLLAVLVVYLLQGVVLSNQILETTRSRYADPVGRLEREQRIVAARTVELRNAVKEAKASEGDDAPRVKDLQKVAALIALEADGIGRKLFEARSQSLRGRRSGNAWGLLVVASIELVVVVIRTKVPGWEKFLLGAIALLMALLAIGAAWVTDCFWISVLAGLAVALLALLVALVAVGSWTLAPIVTVLVLMLICIAVGRLHPRRFFWLGITVFMSVSLFGAVLTYSRDRHAPSAQAAAVLLKNGCAVEGVWVGENADRVFLARVHPDGEASSESGQQLTERNQAEAGLIFSLDRSQVISESIGKLRRVPYAGRQAEAMRAQLLAIQGENNLSTAACTATGQTSDYFAGEMSSFRGPATLHAEPLRTQLCLVRYFDRRRAEANNSDPGANWWTTCEYNATLRSVALVHAKLALPKAWGARDARIVATIPAGTRITYLSGIAARQCEAASHRCYEGGGVQLLFHDRDVSRSWFQSTECADGRESAPARFVACRL
jgi:hypothetical protein